MNKLIINSRSSGKFRTEFIDNREFLVTSLIAAEGDSVMNGLHYDENIMEVIADQLNYKPAPSGHPTANGQSISASDPVLGPSFSFGAHVRNGKVVNGNAVSELWIDTAVANRSSDGREAISTIESGGRIGVSTGGTGRVVREKGTNKKGVSFIGKVVNFAIDHLAVLLRESPAGDITYTLNSSEFFNQKPKGTIMREITIDTSNLSLDDHKFLELNSGDASAICNALKHDVTEQEASTVLENAGKAIVPAREYEDFLANRDSLKEFNSIKADERKEQIEFVLSNSKMDEAHLAELTTDALTSLVNSIAPKNKHILNGKFEEPTLDALEGA